MRDHLAVLLVDDDAHYAALVQGALQAEFSRVDIHPVVTREEFSHALDVGGFDVLITECHLPWTTSGEILDMVRARQPGRPVMMMTAAANEKAAAEALGLGFDSYVLKAAGFDLRLRVAVGHALHQAESRVRAQRAERRLGRLLTRLNVGVFRSAGDGRILDANPAFLALLGFSSLDEAQAWTMDKLYLLREERARLLAKLREHGSVQGVEVQLRRADGRIIWVSMTKTVSSASEGEMAFDGLIEDITDGKDIENLQRHDALYDGLTGLPNRFLFMDRLRDAVERSALGGGYAFALYIFNIDRFRFVNDSFGHVLGDQLIIAIAHRLQSRLRSCDVLARLGGDEFAMLVEGMSAPAEAERIAERIHQDLECPFDLCGHELFASTSVGIALSAGAATSSEAMLRDADTALHRAKSKGRARHEVFHASMHAHAVDVLRLERDLRRALEKNELRIHYQPIVSMEDWRITGFEALLRWQHPERGLILPEEFIPLAEETGLIIPIGNWVLLEACRQTSVWHAAYPSDPAISIAVNLSSKNLTQPELVQEVRKVLAQSGMSGLNLGLEITESALVQNAQQAIAILGSLRALNVSLHIDDFGTGYSSLSYLQKFPIDTLKIDRSFIAQLPESGQNKEIVSTIISLAQKLGLGVIAEGVETREQAESLRRMKCEQAQGFFFHHPLDPDQASALLMSRGKVYLA